MNRTTASRIRATALAGLGAALLVTAASTLTAPAAVASTVTPSKPAANQQVSTASVRVSTALPNALTVAGHRGQPVTVWTKGTTPITMRPLDARAVTFRGLLAGRAYAIYVGADRAATVRTMSPAGVVTKATASRGAEPGTMDVRWQHTRPETTAPIRYLVRATSPSAPIVRRIVTGTSATLTGLDPRARYTITVTPYAAKVRGTGAVASIVAAQPGVSPGITVLPAVSTAQVDMSEPETPAPASEAPATPSTPSTPAPVTPVVPAPATAPAPTPAPVPAPAPTPAPAPIPAPQTRLVCPDGWTDAGANCTQTSPYTYSTLQYTYRQGITSFVDVGFCQYYDPATSQWVSDNHCLQPVYGNVKDATPSGYEDTGTEWRRTDAPPAGWTDNGTAYERTTAKIEVPV